MWVLKCKRTGRYVSKPGSKFSYTLKLENAQKFKSRDHALDNACKESEYPLQIDLFNLFN